MGEESMMMAEDRDESVYPNWFKQTAQPQFQRYLSMVAGKPELRFLQIGAFVGDASVWMLENVLTHPTSYLVDVDPWQAYQDLVTPEGWNWEEVRGYYLERMEPWFKPSEGQSRLLSYRMTSWKFYTRMPENSLYDFIYIDGAHDGVSVLEDAVMAYRHLKPHGLLAFDDYTWAAPDGNPLNAPRAAIDAVRYLYQGKLVVLEARGQVWMVKGDDE